MLVLEIVIVAVIVFGVAAVTMGHGGSITHFTPDWPGRGLPEDRTLRAADVHDVRFSLAVRGYRMSEVDAALARLEHEIAVRDARIEQLTGRPYEDPAVDHGVAPVAPAAEQQAYEQQAYEPQAYEQQAYEQQAYEPHPYDTGAPTAVYQPHDVPPDAG